MKLATTIIALLSTWVVAAAAKQEKNESSLQAAITIVKCNLKTEETCYDDWHKAISCSLISDGGCPCREGLVKCDADLANGYAGYCTGVCCDRKKKEYLCYEGKGQDVFTGIGCGTFEDGCACPEGQQECIKNDGFCLNVCCDHDSEEYCYGPNNTSVCAKFADGGCPCPEGTAKCGQDLDNNYAGYCTDVCCDQKTEETCYDYNWDPFNTTCALIANGGCPCPESQVKCGQDLDNNYAGYCTDVCCDQKTEETCYDYDWGTSNTTCALIAYGGCPCPEGAAKCGQDLDNGYAGYCTDVCCDWKTEETCYNYETGTSYCAKNANGGCPCPEGQVKCGQDLDNDYAGYCTDVCCDQKTEETCYDYDGGTSNTNYCALIANGGCPCLDDQVKCGQDLDYGYAGWCTDVCCDQKTEETCYDYDGGTSNTTCALIANGGCPCPESQVKCGQDLDNGYAGYCTDVCCDWKTEETCYNYDSYVSMSCAAIADGGCQCPENHVRCGNEYIDNRFVGCLSVDACTLPLADARSPVTEAPTTTKPTTTKPTTKNPTTTQPTSTKPTTKNPTTKNPTTAKPTTSKPTTKKPTTTKPTTTKPTTKKPTTKKPTTKIPTTKNPTRSKPTTMKPTTKNPDTKNPTKKNPTTTKPTMTKSTTAKLGTK